MTSLPLTQQAALFGAGYFLLFVLWKALVVAVLPGRRSLATLLEYGLLGALGWLSWKTLNLVVDNNTLTGPLATAAVLGALIPSVAWGVLSKFKPRGSSRAFAGVKSAGQLARLVKSSGDNSSLKVGTAPLPEDAEAAHLLVIGDADASRQELLASLVAQIRQRGDQAVVLDRDGMLMGRGLNAATDHVFNPEDERCPAWALGAELTGAWDAAALARSLLPDGAHEDRDIVSAGQSFLTAIIRKLFDTQELTQQALQETVMSRSLDELEVLVKGTPGAQLLGSPWQLEQVRGLVGPGLAMFASVPFSKAGFSFGEVLKSGKAGTVFVPYNKARANELNRWLAAVADTALRAVTGQDADTQRRVWLVLPNLEDLGRIQSLESALPRGKKSGLRVLAALGNADAVAQTYGASATAVFSGFGSVAASRCSDKQTAELAAEGVNLSGETAITDSQLNSLKPARGLLRLHGGYPVCDFSWSASKGAKVPLALKPQGKTLKRPIQAATPVAPSPDEGSSSLTVEVATTLRDKVQQFGAGAAGVTEADVEAAVRVRQDSQARQREDAAPAFAMTPSAEPQTPPQGEASPPQRRGLSARMGVRSSGTFRVPDLPPPEEDHIALHVDEPGRTREAVSKVVTRVERGAMYAKWEAPRPQERAFDVVEATAAAEATQDTGLAAVETPASSLPTASNEQVEPRNPGPSDAPPAPAPAVRRPRSAVFTKAVDRSAAVVSEPAPAPLAVPLPAEPPPFDAGSAPGTSVAPSAPAADAAAAKPQQVVLHSRAMELRAAHPVAEPAALAAQTGSPQPTVADSHSRADRGLVQSVADAVIEHPLETGAPPPSSSEAATGLELPSSRRRKPRPEQRRKDAASGPGRSRHGGRAGGASAGRDLLKLLG